MKKLYFCLLLLAFSYWAKAQMPRYFNYSVEQGLPSSETYDVMQDSKGFIWISTDRGAVRYNGYEFKVFTTNDGLPSNTVFSTIEDEEGRIWFLSFNKKLSYYYNNRILPYKYNHILEKTIQGTPDPRILHYSKERGLYVSYDRNGLLHIDPAGKVEQLITLEDNCSRKFFVANVNNLPFFGSLSLIHTKPVVIFFEALDENKKQKYSCNFEEIGWTEHIVSVRRKDGTHLAATSKQLYEWKQGVPLRIMTLDKQPNRIREDRDSCLWLCVFRGGAKKYSSGPLNLTNEQLHLLKDKSVTCMLHDAEGGYWFSTMESGVYYFPQFNYLSAATPMFNTPSEVSAITGDGKNTVFVAYSNGVIEKMEDNQYKKVIKIRGQISFVHGFWYDNVKGHLYCGNSSGLKIFSKDGALIKGKRYNARAIGGENINDYYWGDERLYWQKNDSSILLSGEMPPIRIDDLCRDEKGGIQLGTLSGAYRYDPVEKTYKELTLLKNVRVKEIKNLGNGKMAYATLGKGVVLVHGKQVTIVDEKSGLASNMINGITNDNDTLWAATTRGISRLILLPDTILVNNFDQYNGLPTNEIKVIYQNGPNVWLGTKQGLYWFNPNKIIINTLGPRLYIEEVRVNEKPVYGRHVFSSSENNLSFNFLAINYKKRGNIQYRYRLLGYDQEWKYTTNRNVNYLSLPSGEYKFEIQARNQDGYWSVAGASFHFFVARPFYLTWWFIVIAILLVTSVVYFLVRRRIRAIRYNNQMVLLMNEYRSMALASQINPHFIFNSLNSIQAFIIHEDRVSASKYLSSFARLMRKSLDHSRLDFVLLRDEVELLEMYLSLEQLRFKNKFVYHFDIDQQINLEEISIPTMIFQPFIENSIRHGIIPLQGSEGRVTIRMKIEKNMLRCEVEDNGVGRNAKVQKSGDNTVHRSYGIEITSERIRIYCRNEGVDFLFNIEDGMAGTVGTAGTKVIFYLPYRKVKHEN